MRTRSYGASGCVRLWKGVRGSESDRGQGGCDGCPGSIEEKPLPAGEGCQEPGRRYRDDRPPHSASRHGGADPRRRRPFRKAGPHSHRPWPVLAGCRLHPPEVRAGRWLAQLSVGLPQGGGSGPRFPGGAGKLLGAVSRGGAGQGGVGEGGLWEQVAAEFYFSRRNPRHCFCRAACLQNYSCVLVFCPSAHGGEWKIPV